MTKYYEKTQSHVSKEEKIEFLHKPNKPIFSNVDSKDKWTNLDN